MIKVKLIDVISGFISCPTQNARWVAPGSTLNSYFALLKYEGPLWIAYSFLNSLKENKDWVTVTYFERGTLNIVDLLKPEIARMTQIFQPGRDPTDLLQQPGLTPQFGYLSFKRNSAALLCGQVAQFLNLISRNVWIRSFSVESYKNFKFSVFFKIVI